MQMGKDALTSWVYSFFRQHESLFLLPSSISNHKKIVRQLKVDALAAAAGKQNLPASTATGPDNHEQFIEWYFREQGKTLYARYQSQLKRLLIRQQQAAGIFDVQGFEEHLGAALQALTHLTATSRDQLITARKEERQSLSELNAFKVCHDIQRDAVFPVSREWHYALPVAMGMVEGIANSGFFAVGLETAWLGGLQQALLIAAMNVGVSFHAGVALRGLHSPGVYRLAAGALGVAYGVGLCLFHLAVGHYRTALMQNPESAAITAVNNFIYAPLALGDFHSWLLTLVGVMFGLGAAMSGYKADDPFPGYRPLTRRYKAAVAIYRHLKEQYLLGIEEVIDTQLSAVDTHIEEARKALNTYLELSAEITQLKRNYQFAAIAINDACVAVLQRYRAQNRAVRQHPAPPYFAEEVHCPLVDELNALVPSAGAEATFSTADCRTKLSQLQAKITEVKRQLRELHRRTLNYTPLFFESIAASTDESKMNHHQDHASPLADYKEQTQEASYAKN